MILFGFDHSVIAFGACFHFLTAPDQRLLGRFFFRSVHKLGNRRKALPSSDDRVHRPRNHTDRMLAPVVQPERSHLLRRVVVRISHKQLVESSDVLAHSPPLPIALIAAFKRLGTVTF